MKLQDVLFYHFMNLMNVGGMNHYVSLSHIKKNQQKTNKKKLVQIHFEAKAVMINSHGIHGLESSLKDLAPRIKHFAAAVSRLKLGTFFFL